MLGERRGQGDSPVGVAGGCPLAPQSPCTHRSSAVTDPHGDGVAGLKKLLVGLKIFREKKSYKWLRDNDSNGKRQDS